MWRARYKQRSWLFYLFAGFLLLGFGKVAFLFLPWSLAALACVGMLALFLILFPSPSEREQQDEFKQELEQSKRDWRKWNR